MANLKTEFVTYTTVAVILVLDVRICGQLKRLYLRQQKLVSHNFHRKLEKWLFKKSESLIIFVIVRHIGSHCKILPL